MSEAEELLREHLLRQPNNRPALVWLAATYARIGRLEEAQATAARILRLTPGYTIDGAARQLMPFQRSEHAERIFQALVMAGIPEK
jgi:predicted Zn-dependent protease